MFDLILLSISTFIGFYYIENQLFIMYSRIGGISGLILFC